MAAGYQVHEHDEHHGDTPDHDHLLADHELMYHDPGTGLIVMDVETGTRSVLLGSSRCVS